MRPRRGRAAPIGRLLLVGLAAALFALLAVGTAQANPTINDDGNLVFTWGPPSDLGDGTLQRYEVRVSTDAGSTWGTVEEIATTVTSYTITPVAGTNYAFEVRAVTDAAHGEGPWSRWEPWRAPRMRSVASTSATSLEARWRDRPRTRDGPTFIVRNDATDVSDYDVRYRTVGATSWTDANYDGTETSHEITGLTTDTAYEVQVRATNIMGTSPWSSTGTGTPVANTAPVFSSNGMFTVKEHHSGRVGRITASDPDEGETVTGYRLSGPDAGRFWFFFGNLFLRHVPDYERPRDSGRDNVYNLTITATSGTGSDARSSELDVTVTVTNVDPPAAPGNLRMTDTGRTTLDIDWDKPGDGGKPIIRYEIEYKTAGWWRWTWTQKRILTWQAHSDDSQTDQTLRNLRPNEDYDVRVRGVNIEGKGPWTTIVARRTVANQPPAFPDECCTFDLPEHTDGSVTPVVVGRVQATDPDSGDWVAEYEIYVGSDKFRINSSGQISYVGTGEEYEGRAAHVRDFNLFIRATDSRGDYAEEGVTVRITDIDESLNAVPTADAGADRTVSAGATVTLDGSGSRDADGDRLTYRWRQLHGPTVALSATDAAMPSFTTPAEAAMLLFELIVADAIRNSPPAVVMITVTEPEPEAETQPEGDPETGPETPSESEPEPGIQPSHSHLAGFTLLDGDDGRVIGPLLHGATVDSGLGKLEIRADLKPGQSIGSVRLVLQGPTSVSRTENWAPYEAYGGHDGQGRELAPGDYTLTATPYTGFSLSGQALSALSITFTVQ